MSIQIRGVQELIRGLRQNANLTDVKRVVAQNGSELQKKAMRNVPVDTGTLKRSVRLDIEDKGFTARVSANTNYAAYVEYGTRYMHPRRYMKRAFDQQRKTFRKDMNRLVK